MSSRAAFVIRVVWFTSLTTLAVSMLIFAAGCASSDPDAGRTVLPATPQTFGKPVKLPAATVGKSLRTFGLESYAAALEANRRLINDRKFWDGVRREYERRRTTTWSGQ